MVAVRTLTRTEALPAMTWASTSSGIAANASADSPIHADDSTITKARTPWPSCGRVHVDGRAPDHAPLAQLPHALVRGARREARLLPRAA